MTKAQPTGLGAVVKVPDGRRVVRTFGARFGDEYYAWQYEGDAELSGYRWSELPKPVTILSEGVQ